ncbi:hypothetical protein [Acidithiobacillus sp.]|uniref:hypothetical protein n=1 Tax=Acidithiobacillus sp. TaxID=1872118 RepID=UPI003D00FFB3
MAVFFRQKEDLPMPTAAETEKLEVAGVDRKDGQDEETPVWADALMKSHQSLVDRMDAMEKDRKDADERRPVEAADKQDSTDKKDDKDEGEDPTETTQGEKKADAVKADAAEDKKEDAKADAAEDREDRARKDAAQSASNRATQAKIAELEKQLSAVYREPTMEDRNALSETRARADGIYQALTGQTASAPMPGESPISYRKRMADGLRKYSDRMKEVRVDSLTGEAFKLIEDTIYEDAQNAIRSDSIIPEGQLRKIVRMDRGREKTEYVGDPSVTWGPFSAGAVMGARLTNPSVKH